MSFERQVTTSAIYKDLSDGVYPQDTDGIGIYVADLRNINVALVAKDGFEGTVKLLGSIQKEKPDFSAAATITNEYTEVTSVLMSTDDRIDGVTGFVFTGAEDGSYVLQMNTDLLTWIAVQVSNVTAGTVDFFVTSASNI